MSSPTAAGRVEHLGQLRGDRVSRRELSRGELAEAEDDGEQVVEVVRHAPGEQADGLHLLRLAQLLFEPLPRGRVLHHGDPLEGRAVGAANEVNGGLHDDGVAGLGEERQLALPGALGAYAMRPSPRKLRGSIARGEAASSASRGPPSP